MLSTNSSCNVLLFYMYCCNRFLSVSRTLEHQSSTPFVIDGDDDEDDEHHHHHHKTNGSNNDNVDHSIPTAERDKDTNTISISRTDQQRQQVQYTTLHLFCYLLTLLVTYSYS